jgi:hypothetical protein
MVPRFVRGRARKQAKTRTATLAEKAPEPIPRVTSLRTRLEGRWVEVLLSFYIGHRTEEGRKRKGGRGREEGDGRKGKGKSAPVGRGELGLDPS